MKLLNHLYCSAEELEVFIENNQISSYRESVLIQLFSSVIDKVFLEEISALVHKLLPQATLIGTTTAGEIADGLMLEKETLLSFSLFDDITIKSSYAISPDSQKVGEALGRDIVSADTKAAILFADGLQHNGDMLINGFTKMCKRKFPIAGGMAGDLMTFEHTYTVYNDKVFEQGGVAVTLESDTLIVNQNYNLSWQPIGKKMVITRSEGNRVYEIDHRPILDIYRDYLGDDVVTKIPASTIEFPLIHENDGAYSARSMIAKLEDGSIIFAGDMPQGQSVRFGMVSESQFYTTSEQTYDTLAKEPVEAIFIYSCSARKAFLSKKLEEYEFKPFNTIAKTAGFFTYGEFYASSLHGELLNITTTVLTLSEKSHLQQQPQPYRSEQEEEANLTSVAALHLLDKIASDLRDKEQKLTQAEKLLEQYKASIDTTLVVSKTDRYGIITYANDKFCQLSGYSRNELLGKNHNIIRHPDTEKIVFKNLWLTIKSGKIWESEIKNLRKDGSTYYVKSFILPIFGEDGLITEYIGIRQDITPLIQTQNEVLKEKYFVDSIINSSENIIMISKNGELIEMNAKFFKLFDYTDLAEFSHKHLCPSELFIEREGYLKKSTQSRLWFKDILEDKKHIHKAVMLDKDANEVIFSIGIKEFLWDDDSYAVFTLSDITDIEKARIKAEEAEAFKSLFLANMSHEIRTPMNGILGFGELLSQTELNPKQRNYVNTIHSSSKLLLEIINDILDLSKIQNKKLHIESVPVDPHREFKTTFDLLKATAFQKDIDYEYAIDPTVSECLSMDPVRTQQVIINFLSNAIKFTPVHGKVHFKIECLEDTDLQQRLRFNVIDTGIGIAEEKINTIFEPFSQVDISTARKFGGTGLGLTICTNLVHLMGSTIQVESQEGEGSRFYFELELPKCDKTTIHPALEHSTLLNRVSNYEGLSVLVAEDYEVNRMLMEELFKAYQIRVDFALDGKEAVSSALHKHYDLIFMDINMPHMDGIEATKILREEGLATPIIALTANAMQEDRDKYIQMGMDDYLGKPIEFNELDRILSFYTHTDASDSPEATPIEQADAIVQTMQEKTGFPQEIVIQLLQAFLDSAVDTLQDVKQAAAQKDYELLYTSLHQINGAAGNLRLENIHQVAKELEQAAKEHKEMNYLEEVEKIEIDMMQLTAWLESNA
ncbi:MAG: FIST N-terminal domain-containing protein [Campylobacterota bacterium]